MDVLAQGQRQRQVFLAQKRDEYRQSIDVDESAQRMYRELQIAREALSEEDTEEDIDWELLMAEPLNEEQRMASMDLLGLKPGFSQAQLRAAYDRMARDISPELHYVEMIEEEIARSREQERDHEGSAELQRQQAATARSNAKTLEDSLEIVGFLPGAVPVMHPRQMPPQERVAYYQTQIDDIGSDIAAASSEHTVLLERARQAQDPVDKAEAEQAAWEALATRLELEAEAQQLIRLREQATKEDLEAVIEQREAQIAGPRASDKEYGRLQVHAQTMREESQLREDVAARHKESILGSAYVQNILEEAIRESVRDTLRRQGLVIDEAFVAEQARTIISSAPRAELIARHEAMMRQIAQSLTGVIPDSARILLSTDPAQIASMDTFALMHFLQETGMVDVAAGQVDPALTAFGINAKKKLLDRAKDPALAQRAEAARSEAMGNLGIAFSASVAEVELRYNERALDLDKDRRAFEYLLVRLEATDRRIAEAQAARESLLAQAEQARLTALAVNPEPEFFLPGQVVNDIDDAHEQYSGRYESLRAEYESGQQRAQEIFIYQWSIEDPQSRQRAMHEAWTIQAQAFDSRARAGELLAEWRGIEARFWDSYDPIVAEGLREEQREARRDAELARRYAKEAREEALSEVAKKKQ